MSKVFERCLYNQLSVIFDKILSKYQCESRKGFNAQHCLIIFFGALLADLSKAFDCFSHELLVAKLIAYGVEISSLIFIYDYFTDRKRRTKIGNNYSSWRDILYGVPEGSIFLIFQFNIFQIYKIFEIF